MTLKIGDVVVLRSGGTSMTVESIEGDSVKCVWHDGKVIRERVFTVSMLTEGNGTLEWALEQIEKREREGK